MFGMSGTELIIIAIVALLLFPPHKLPEMARQLGKGLREFRKATEGIRQTVEQEFYKMDQDIEKEIGVHDVPIEPPPISVNSIQPPAPAPSLPSAAPTPSPAATAQTVDAPNEKK